MKYLVLSALAALAWAAAAPSAKPVLPGDKEPLPRVEADGPTAFVTALAFDRDGERLYAAGWDKVVRVSARGKDGRFALDRAAFRVPVGPGVGGAINAIALSDDGRLLAVAGSGTFRGAAGFRQEGVVYPAGEAMGPEMRKDEGTIYVFDTRGGKVRLLRGHQGQVQSLAFAPSRPGKPPLLVSAGYDWSEKAGKKVGTVILWNVEKETYLDYVPNLPRPDTFRPGLAVWPSGPGVTDLRIAFAWDDGTFRVWHAERKEDWMRTAKDATLNITAAYDPGSDRVVTAVYGHGAPSLTLWDATGAAPTAKEKRVRGDGPADRIPRALALAASRADGKYDLAAVVNVSPMKSPPTDDDFSLQLLDLRRGSVGDVRADLPLWRGPPKQPVLAAAPNGRYLAVAGNADQEIRVYPIADLLKGDKTYQGLRGAGLPIRYAAFVKKGGEQGLVLGELSGKPHEPADGDLIFDLGKRHLGTERDGWRADAPDAKGWAVKPLEAERGAPPGVAVSRDGKLVRRVRLPAEPVTDPRDYELTAWALLPPGPGRKVPLLALASHLGGQPLLALYDAESGRKLRHLTSHVERITSLAFSGNGRLLVSAGEDRTVCVWSLTTLDKVIGRLGRIDAVTVGRGDKGAAVVSRVVDKDGPAVELRPGDVIEAVVIADKERSVPTAADYYEIVNGTAPGTPVKLRVRGEAGRRDVSLKVSQGVDERKPLFSLFVTAKAKSGEREWIGWTPAGPYESSGAGAERYLGWHFNTGDPAEPTRFALAGEYRDRYYREGLLKELVASERVVPAPPKPAPQVGLAVGGEGGAAVDPDARQQYLVRAPDVKLTVSLGDRAIDTLEAIAWQLDDGARRDLPLKGLTGRDVTLPLALTRGAHRVRVTVRAPDSEPREVVRELTLRYQPPAPRVVARDTERRLVVKDAAFTLRAEVRPGRADEAVNVRLSHRLGDKELDSKTYKIGDGKPLAVEWPLTLKTGTNLVEIVAVNAGAAAEEREAETTRLALEVTLTEKPPPPVIALSVLPGGNADKLAAEPGRDVLVRGPRVRLAAKVTASRELAEVEWAPGADGKLAAAAGFVAGKAKEFSLDDEVKLKPGRQTFHFRAKTADSDPAERAVTIFYQPQLPRVVITEPADGSAVFGEADTEVVALKARVFPPADAEPYKAEVLVNGRKADAAPERDAQGETLTARVPVKPGETRFEVRLSNDWDAVVVSGPARVRYARPPVVVKLARVSDPKAALHEFRAEVRSPLELLPKSVVLEVNGKPRSAEVSPPAAGAVKGTWEVRIKGVALEQGRNEVRLRVANAEGECREPGAASVDYDPVEPMPVVEFLSPADSKSVTESLLKVRFRVRSASRIEAARLLHDGEPPLDIDAAAQKADGAGGFELIAERDLRLAPRDNALRLEARNAGGVADARLTVSYQRPPVEVRVDAVAVRGAAGGPLTPDFSANGTPVFERVSAGRVRLKGRVLWSPADDERLGKAAVVRVLVNGFQQLPAELQAPAGGRRERAFEADLLLNQAGKNRVELSLPALEADTASVKAFDLDCAAPVRAQRLHLLIASVREQDEEPLRSEFFKALQSKWAPGRELETPAFRPVYLYGPLVGTDVRRERVFDKLSQIRSRIKGLAGGGAAGSDVVVFYYRGNEEIGASGNVLKMAPGHEGLTCDYLARFFADTPGAHVLLFDVSREGKAEPGRDKVARWDDSFPDVKNHVAVLRYAFLGPGAGSKSPALVAALEQAMPKATKLYEVVDLIRGSVPADEAARTKVDAAVPEPLGGMTVNEKR